MENDLDRLELAGETIAPGSSMYVVSTGEVAWVASIHDDHLRIETVDDAGGIDIDLLEERLESDDIVLESTPGAGRLVE